MLYLMVCCFHWRNFIFFSITFYNPENCNRTIGRKMKVGRHTEFIFIVSFFGYLKKQQLYWNLRSRIKSFSFAVASMRKTLRIFFLFFCATKSIAVFYLYYLSFIDDFEYITRVHTKLNVHCTNEQWFYCGKKKYLLFIVRREKMR